MKYTGLIKYHILNQFPAFTDSVGNKWGALDIVDGAIIDWIMEFFPRAKKETNDGVVYMFVSNQYLISDMPILGIKSDRAIRARVERMIAHGVLIRWHKDFTEQYLAVTKKWSDKEWMGRNQTSEGSEPNFRGGRNETSDNSNTTHPLSNPPSSPKRVKDPIQDGPPDDLKAIWEAWNACGVKKHRYWARSFTTASRKALGAYSEAEIIKAFQNYVFVVKSDRHFFSYKWALDDFLNRGLENFVDENDPLKNYLKDKSQFNGSPKKHSTQTEHERIMAKLARGEV